MIVVQFYQDFLFLVVFRKEFTVKGFMGVFIIYFYVFINGSSQVKNIVVIIFFKLYEGWVLFELGLS